MSLQVPFTVVAAKSGSSHLVVATFPSLPTVCRLLPVSIGLRLSARPSPASVSGISRALDRPAAPAVAPRALSDRSVTSVTTGLNLLQLALTTVLTTACGSRGTQDERDDPLSIGAPETFESALYSVDTYIAQDLPDNPREGVTSLQEDFDIFGIAFAEVDTFAKAVPDFCGYRTE